MTAPLLISQIRHPFYDESIQDWELWRRTYEGGERFIELYLEKLSSREDQNDFDLRKKLTYCPAFAKEAIVEIKNSIYQRFNDITRTGGSKTYQDATKGDLKGVDLIGSSMNSFIGQEVLPELLSMGRVGVYVDMPSLTGTTMRDRSRTRPYLYISRAEDICSWSCDNSEDPNEFTQLLLRENYDIYEPQYNLPMHTGLRYRYMYKTLEGQIYCSFFNTEGEMIDSQGNRSDESFLLQLNMIPFVLFHLSHSLLTDVAKYQIALLNLASADMSYAIKSNFPFYTEQYDIRQSSAFLKQTDAATEGTGAAADKEVKVGVSQGRRYPLGTERPGFIHPSSEPLKISMEKQEQLKQEIRQLVQLAVTSLNPNKQASAESKSLDNQGLEAGLSYIGLELERGERRIANFWAIYESSKQIATVNYPEKYSLKSDSQRNEDSKNLISLAAKIPSNTAQKEISKQAVRILLSSKVSLKTLEQIEKEIETATSLTSDFEQIAKDVEMGLVDRKTASKARGYPEGSVEKAEQEHADRLARIAKSQGENNDNMGGARGTPDTSSNPSKDGSEEKAESRKTDEDPIPTDKTRGKGEGKSE